MFLRWTLRVLAGGSLAATALWLNLTPGFLYDFGWPLTFCTHSTQDAWPDTLAVPPFGYDGPLFQVWRVQNLLLDVGICLVVIILGTDGLTRFMLARFRWRHLSCGLLLVGTLLLLPEFHYAMLLTALIWILISAAIYFTWLAVIDMIAPVVSRLRPRQTGLVPSQ